MIREEVRALQAMGAFPNEDDVTPERVDEYDALLESITPPVSDEEAAILVGLFGPDSLYGVAWSVVHLVETAPGWHNRTALSEAHPEWRETLEQRLRNSKG